MAKQTNKKSAGKTKAELSNVRILSKYIKKTIVTIEQQNKSYLKVEKFRIIMPIQVRDLSIFDKTRFKVQIMNDENDEESKLVLIQPREEK